MLHVLYSVLASLQRPYLLLLLLPSLPSNRVFTIMYLKQTMVLGYIVGTVLSVQYLTRVILFPMIHILYLCSVQYGCFLHFLDVMLCRYVTQVLSE